MVGPKWRAANSFAPQLIWAAARRKAAESAKLPGRDMAKTNPFEFLQQVRAEGSKVTWPTRKETMITTAMVFVMAVLASIFFLVVDVILQRGVSLILGLG
jgi:preprotein translocase subunit SecE